ncbi:MAG: hypothetical protein CSA62_09715 [Planctomycetota bacterium]|nr:MAG: hypothetical protein CSA62_09715 [Planctomycetota bacterium]
MLRIACLLLFCAVLLDLGLGAQVPASWEKAKTAAEREAFVAAVLASRGELARRKALELWERPGRVELRLRLLEHAAGLSGIEAPMLRVVEEAKSAAEKFVGLRWFLREHRGEGLEAMQVLADEKPQPALNQALLAALVRSSLPEAKKLFAARLAQAGDEDRVEMMRILSGVKEDAVAKLRQGFANKAKGLLQAEALAQQIAFGEPRAVRKARKLLRQRPSPKSRARLFDALLGYAKPSDLQLCAIAFHKPDLRLLAAFRKRLPELAAREDVLDWVEEGLKHRDARIRSFAGRILLGMRGDRAEALLCSLSKSQDKRLRRRALLALARQGAPETVAIVETLLASKDEEARLDGLEALEVGAPFSEVSQRRLLEVLQKGSSDEKVLGIAVATKRKLPGAYGELPGWLGERDWRLRSAGYRYAAALRRVESIPLLITALSKEEGRLAYECKKALNSLTRLWYEEPARWQRWWAESKGSFVLPPAPEEKEAERSEAGGSTVAFYGIPVMSTRVVYGLDVSGSMNEEVGSSLTRMDLAKRALKKALDKAPPGSQVNVLFFDSEVHEFSQRLVDLARKRDKDKLYAFLDSSTPLGGTNLHAALFAALEQPEVDTIFLLSDGDPSVGAVLDPLELADAVLRANRTRRVRIHGVAVGLDSVLLRRLAEATGGRYVQSL